jgi:hypothetical protein
LPAFRRRRILLAVMLLFVGFCDFFELACILCLLAATTKKAEATFDSDKTREGKKEVT